VPPSEVAISRAACYEGHWASCSSRSALRNYCAKCSNMPWRRRAAATDYLGTHADPRHAIRGEICGRIGRSIETMPLLVRAERFSGAAVAGVGVSADRAREGLTQLR